MDKKNANLNINHYFTHIHKEREKKKHWTLLITVASIGFLIQENQIWYLNQVIWYTIL